MHHTTSGQAMWLGILVLCEVLCLVGCGSPSAFGQEAPEGGRSGSASRTRPPQAIQAIHEKAAKARELPAFADVEQLRRERLEKLKFGKETSAWTDGLQALRQADKLLQAMQYDDAVAVLKEAWKPFKDEARPREDPVFGDLAVKMFEVHQAALALYPEASPQFPKVTIGEVKDAIDLALRKDPCQVEAIAIEAFLTRPNPDERFQPAELQESLRRRNVQLLNISFAPSEKSLAQPWHAPVELLKAKSTSFVLDDLKYIDDFLAPRRQLVGKDARDEPFAVVLGGALLSTAPGQRKENSGSAFFVDEYVAAGGETPGRWVRMRPRWLTVTPTSRLAEQGFVIEGKAIEDQLRELDGEIVKREDEEILDECRLVATRYAFPAAHQIPQQVGAILANSQPPGVQQKIDKLVTEFGTYVQSLRNSGDFETAKNAEQAIEDYRQLLAGHQQATRNWRQGLETFNPQPQGADQAQWFTLRWLGDIHGRSASIRARLEKLYQSKEPEPDKEVPSGRPGNPLGQPVEGRGEASVAQQIETCEQWLALAESLVFVEFCRRATAQPARAWSAGINPQAAAVDPSAQAAETQSPAEVKARETLAEKYESLAKTAASGRIDAEAGTTIAECVRAIREREVYLPPDLPNSATGNTVRQFFDEFFDKGRSFFEIWQMEQYFASNRNSGQDANGEDSWELRGARWQVEDFPSSWRAQFLAAFIDVFPRVVLRASDLDVMRRAVKGPGGTEAVPLQSKCSTITGNPLVYQRGAEPVVMVGKTAVERSWQGVVLVIHEEDQPGGPKCAVGEDGKDFLWFDGEGTRVRGAFNLTEAEPHIAIDYPGVEGRVVLGAVPDPLGPGSGRWRYLLDRRGNRIEIAPVESSSLLKIVSSSGQELVDRTVNYSVEDWVALDRNVVNEFMPLSLALSPSLPTWQVYERALLRARPRIPQSSRWTVPRPAFRSRDFDWSNGGGR